MPFEFEENTEPASTTNSVPYPIGSAGDRVFAAVFTNGVDPTYPDGYAGFEFGSSAFVTSSGTWQVFLLHRERQPGDTVADFEFESSCNSTVTLFNLPPMPTPVQLASASFLISPYDLAVPATDHPLAGVVISKGALELDVAAPPGDFTFYESTLDSTSSITGRMIAWAYEGVTAPTFEITGNTGDILVALVEGRLLTSRWTLGKVGWHP